VRQAQSMSGSRSFTLRVPIVDQSSNDIDIRASRPVGCVWRLWQSRMDSAGPAGEQGCFAKATHNFTRILTHPHAEASVQSTVYRSFKPRFKIRVHPHARAGLRRFRSWRVILHHEPVLFVHQARTWALAWDAPFSLDVLPTLMSRANHISWDGPNHAGEPCTPGSCIDVMEMN